MINEQVMSIVYKLKPILQTCQLNYCENYCCSITLMKLTYYISISILILRAKKSSSTSHIVILLRALKNS